jgi:hypothetical protein
MGYAPTAPHVCHFNQTDIRIANSPIHSFPGTPQREQLLPAIAGRRFPKVPQADEGGLPGTLRPIALLPCPTASTLPIETPATPRSDHSSAPVTDSPPSKQWPPRWLGKRLSRIANCGLRSGDSITILNTHCRSEPTAEALPETPLFGGDHPCHGGRSPPEIPLGRGPQHRSLSWFSVQ